MSRDLLYEIANVHPVRGEPRRRWFFSHEMDLIVWFDDEDGPSSFQLAYDRHRRVERVIRWSSEQGYSHHRVAEERRPSAGSALLVPDDVFDAPRVRARFLALSAELPAPIAGYVANRLLAHPAHRANNHVAAALALAVVVAIPLLILALVGSTRSGRRRNRD